MKKILKKNYKKIGLLGGTFDPPHLGHLQISKIALKKLKLDFVFWLVTKKNPFKKKPHLSISKRIKLSKKITKKTRKIKIQYLDELAKSKNTYDLLNFLKKKNKKIKLFFLMGADNMIYLHKWKNWQKIPKLAKIVVFPRTGYSTKAVKSIAAKRFNKNDWQYINFKKINISSSLIRKFW